MQMSQTKSCRNKGGNQFDEKFEKVNTAKLKQKHNLQQFLLGWVRLQQSQNETFLRGILISSFQAHTRINIEKGIKFN